MSAQSAAADGRRLAESIMPSICTIRRRTGTRTTGADGMETDTWEVTYSGLPLRLRDVSTSSGGAAPRVTGRAQQGVEVNHARHIVSLPATTTNLADGDHIEITSGENTGAVLRIVESDWADLKTARRVPVEAAERPEEW